MKLSTYKSLITNKKTMLVASKGKCGYEDYIEYQILLSHGQWLCYKTNGYELDLVGTFSSEKGIKSVLNLIWGR